MPGASEVFTTGLTLRPRSTAFFASKPAASITRGLLVFVQLVMAAISTEPWRIFAVRTAAPSAGTGSGVGTVDGHFPFGLGFVPAESDACCDTGSWLPPLG